MIATERDTEQVLYDLGPADLIPAGEGRMFSIGPTGATRVAVFRTRSGRIYATQADCPHRGAPLADGITSGQTVVCPYHSNKFDLQTGEPLGNDCAALKTYRVTVAETGILLLSGAQPDRGCDE